MFCCLRGCLDGLGFAPAVPHIPRENPIQLDTAYMGNISVKKAVCLRKLE